MGRSPRRRALPDSSELPAYDAQLSGFHYAFAQELRSIVETLPLDPGMRVLDVACGDGFYTQLLAHRLNGGGTVTGVDVNPAYIAKAQELAARSAGSRFVDYIAAPLEQLPFEPGHFDFIWCAQSLYSLPEPTAAIAHMARVLRPGGLLAVLENDSLHQVFLPWPAWLELPLRAAELRFFLHSSAHASKYYVGRRLPLILAEAELEPLHMMTHAFDRQAPLEAAEAALLQDYLNDILARVAAHLDAPLLAELRQRVDPASPQHMLRQPHLTMTWVNVLALGRKPMTPVREL